jgi:hypothetical protein
MTKKRMPVTSFEQWYVEYTPEGRNGLLEYRGLAECATTFWNEYDTYKREMDARVSHYDVLEKLADGEVISPKPDLPNVSSGETAGLIRRIARNLVQNTPNVEVVSKFDDDDMHGIFSKHILTSKVIGSDQYSNDMQQNLFASTKTSLTLGFACTIPVLLQDPAKGWFVKYDSVHYRDVFPEPGCKDVREASIVYVRRYLTRQEVWNLIHSDAVGWDKNALLLLVQNPPPNREHQSVPHQTKKHHGMTPEGYEIITRYSNDGDPFLTFSGPTKTLLRIEKNKHPLKQHPVFFLVLEKDDQQPLGKSQVELLVGRQDFQDLMLNGAMKLWYRNINPSIIGYGTVNAIPNLSPGKYTQISNPNAKVEAFEVNTQTLMQYGQISQQNLGSMVQMVGSADQQMAQAGGNGQGMSATPQGVEAQQAMVDITTNNYQKAIESFFSHYCSYALTLYFQELKAVKKVELTADARVRLLEAGLPVELVNLDSTIDIDFSNLSVEYWVRTVPGSLTEMEDEKQLRILNELFIPLSQSMPALASTGNQEALQNATQAMVYIIAKQIELSGASAAGDIGLLWKTGDVNTVNARDEKIQAVESGLNNMVAEASVQNDLQTQAILQLNERMSLMMENQQLLAEKLGVPNQQSESSSPTVEQNTLPERDVVALPS